MKPASFLMGALLSLQAGVASAQDRYARPPDPSSFPAAVESSEPTLRLGVGPAIRVAGGGTAGGLGVALDLGARAVGGRLSGTWVRVGSDGGLSQYGAEIWVDFGAERRLRPIVGAGAAVGRLEQVDTSGSLHTSTLGLGVLRGALEYVLPVSGADARVGLDLQGALPAIRTSDSPDVTGWLLATARVGIGF
jgi:hypothetical protein